MEFLWDFAWRAALLYLLVGILAAVYILARQPKDLSTLLRPRLARRALLALHEHFMLRTIFRDELLKVARRLIGHRPK